MAYPERTRYGSFDLWLNSVDVILLRETGRCHHDHDDFCYLDAFQNGWTPERTAKAVLRQEA